MRKAKCLWIMMSLPAWAALSGCATNESWRWPAWLDAPAAPSSGPANELTAAGNDADSEYAGLSREVRTAEMAAGDADDSLATAQFADVEQTHVSEAAAVATNVTASPTGLLTLQTGQDFDELISHAAGTVLVDFYAEWCGPCKKQALVLHQLEDDAVDHRATIVKVDVDQHPDLQEQFQVTALPTLLVIKNGQIVARQQGLTDRNKLAHWLAN